MTREEAYLIQLLSDVAEIAFGNPTFEEFTAASAELEPRIDEVRKRLPDSIEEHGNLLPFILVRQVPSQGERK